MNPTARRVLEEHRVLSEGVLEDIDNSIDQKRRWLMNEEIQRAQIAEDIRELNESLEAVTC